MAIEDLEHPKPRLTETTTLAEYLQEWLHNTARASVASTTYGRYEVAVRLYLLPHFADVHLVEATPADVRRFKQEMVEKGYAPATISHAQGVLSTALNQAVADGIIHKNPSSMVKKAKARGTKMRILSASQAAALVESARGTRNEALYLLALKVGPRQGEISALTWDHLDNTRGTLLIEDSVDTHAGGNIWGSTKTGEGRTVRLPEGVRATLERHRVMQLEERLKTRKWEDMNLIFPNHFGRVNRRTSLMRDFHKHLDEAGLPRIRFHDLRHTAATLMLNAGVPLPTVSQILGHKNPTQTLNTYSHVLSDHQEEAARRIEENLPF